MDNTMDNTIGEAQPLDDLYNDLLDKTGLEKERDHYKEQVKQLEKKLAHNEKRLDKYRTLVNEQREEIEYFYKGRQDLRNERFINVEDVEQKKIFYFEIVNILHMDNSQRALFKQLFVDMDKQTYIMHKNIHSDLYNQIYIFDIKNYKLGITYYHKWFTAVIKTLALKITNKEYDENVKEELDNVLWNSTRHEMYRTRERSPLRTRERSPLRTRERSPLRTRHSEREFIYERGPYMAPYDRYAPALVGEDEDYRGPFINPYMTYRAPYHTYIRR